MKKSFTSFKSIGFKKRPLAKVYAVSKGSEEFPAGSEFQFYVRSSLKRIKRNDHPTYFVNSIRVYK